MIGDTSEVLGAGGAGAAAGSAWAANEGGGTSGAFRSADRGGAVWGLGTTTTRRPRTVGLRTSISRAASASAFPAADTGGAETGASASRTMDVDGEALAATWPSAGAGVETAALRLTDADCAGTGVFRRGTRRCRRTLCFAPMSQHTPLTPECRRGLCAAGFRTQGRRRSGTSLMTSGKFPWKMDAEFSRLKIRIYRRYFPENRCFIILPSPDRLTKSSQSIKFAFEVFSSVGRGRTV